MVINFSYTPLFEKDYKRLFKKYPSLPQDLLAMQAECSANPDAVGSDLGAGFRKVRLAIRSKGKGKRGGARLITYDLIVTKTEQEVLLVTMYDKSEVDTIELSELKAIVANYNE